MANPPTRPPIDPEQVAALLENPGAGLPLDLLALLDLEERKPFCTGSRVYGTPRPESDLDLVAFCPDLAGMTKLSDSRGWKTKEKYGQRRQSDVMWVLEFPPVELLLCFVPAAYDAWARGTRALSLIAPVTRPTAVALFDAVRVEAGLDARGFELAGEK